MPNIKKNYICSLIYQLLTILTPLITAPYLARVLGADGIGICSYTHSYMVYFTLVAALGTASYGTREIARCRDNRTEYSQKFWEIEILTIFTTSICIIAWLGLIFLYADYRIYFFALLPTLFAVIFDISWFYYGHEKIGYIVFWNSICKLVGVVCIFCFIRSKDDLALYVFLNSFLIMLGNASMWIYLPKMLSKVNPKNFIFKEHFHETLIYFIPTIAVSVYTVLDKTLIGLITRDNYLNGYYEQATKIVNIGKTVVFTAVNTVMAGRMSYLFAENKIDEIKDKIDKSINFILLLGFAVSFGIAAIAKDFVPIFFGAGYKPVITLIYYMAPLIVIIGISNCLGTQYYTPAGLRAQSAIYIVIGAITNLCVNIILIPQFGAKGAVIGSLVAELLISILFLNNCNSYLNLKQILHHSYKRLVSALIMCFSIKIVSQSDLPGLWLLLTEIVIGTGCYFLVLLFLKDDLVCLGLNKIRRRKKYNG